jgi:hypothetical protein
MSTIAECLDTLHQEIVTSWNIYDPNEASNLSPLFLMAEYHTASPEIAIFRANQSPHTVRDTGSRAGEIDVVRA